MDSSYLKKTFIFTIGIGLAVLFGFSLAMLYQSGSLIYFWLSLVSAVLFLTWFVLQVVFLESLSLTLTLFGAEAALMLVPFYANFSWLTLALFAATVWMFYVSRQRARLMLKNSLVFHTAPVSRQALLWASTALALIAAFLYVSPLGSGQAIISRENFRSLIKPVEAGTRVFIPALSLNKKIDILLYDTFQSPLVSIYIPAEIKNAPAAAREELYRQAATNLRLGLSDSAGVPIRSTDTGADVLYNVSVKKLADLSPAARASMPVVLGLIVFLTLRSFLAILAWFAIPLTWFFAKLLKKAGFYRIEIENIQKERVII